MKGKLITLIKYNRSVLVNEMTENMRRDECLCFNCKSRSDCPIAKEGLRLCQLTDIAFMVTRCLKFIDK